MRPTIKILNEKYELYAVPTMRDEIAVQNEMVNLLSINGRNGYEQLAMLDQTIMENRERHRNALIERYGQEGFDNKVAKFKELQNMDEKEKTELLKELATPYHNIAQSTKYIKDDVYYLAYFQILLVNKLQMDDISKDYQENAVEMIKELSVKLEPFLRKKEQTDKTS